MTGYVWYRYRIAQYTMNRPLPILLTAVSAFVALSTVFFQQVKFGYVSRLTRPQAIDFLLCLVPSCIGV